MIPMFLSPERAGTWRAVRTYRPLRILIAEGNRNIRRALALLLRSDGHDVIDAADGLEVLEAIAGSIADGDASQVDLIISAEIMPGISGLSVLAGLRERGRRTPFILLTANATILARARVLGAIVFDGPMNVAFIRQVVRQIDLSTPAAPPPSVDVLPRVDGGAATERCTALGGAL